MDGDTDVAALGLSIRQAGWDQIAPGGTWPPDNDLVTMGLDTGSVGAGLDQPGDLGWNQ